MRAAQVREKPGTGEGNKARGGAASAPVAVATASPAPTTQPMPPPEKAVVLDIHRPWLAGPGWDGVERPKAYGANLDLPEPRFTVIDANAKGYWFYRLAWPIDLDRYPICKIQYRARNVDTANDYVLHLTATGGAFHLMKSTDVVADGNVHEFQTDFREQYVQGKLATIGFWVNSGEKGNASFDLIGMSFTALDNAPATDLHEGEPQKFVVKGEDDKPIAGAKVTVDAEPRQLRSLGHHRRAGRRNPHPQHAVGRAAPRAG